MHTCIHAYIHTHTHIHTYTHTDIHTYIHTYIHTCIYIYIYIYHHTQHAYISSYTTCIFLYICASTHAHTHIYIYIFIFKFTDRQYAYVTYIDNTHTCTEHIWPMETISFHFSIPTWSNDHDIFVVMGRDYQPAGPEGPAGPAGPTGRCRGRDDAEAHGALPDAGTASSGTILATAHQHHLALDCEPPPLLLFTCLNVV